jgi:hypothetical protein
VSGFLAKYSSDCLNHHHSPSYGDGTTGHLVAPTPRRGKTVTKLSTYSNINWYATMTTAKNTQQMGLKLTRIKKYTFIW